MIAAVALITIGFALVAAAVKGVSLADLFAGKSAPETEPSGDTPVSERASGADTDPQGQFKGPNAALLRSLYNAAKNRFHLTPGSTCRSPEENARVGGSSTSLHLQCRAFDSTGSPADMAAFAKYALTFKPAVDEVFYDPLGLTAPGFDHSDHVHVGA